MRWRRRYQVVASGESGAAISQRSVISEHRSERDAREAAGQERRRLEVIRAEEAAAWVITVERDGVVVHEERPFDGRGEDAPVPPVGGPHMPHMAGAPPREEDDQPPAAPPVPATEPGVPLPTVRGVRPLYATPPEAEAAATTPVQPDPEPPAEEGSPAEERPAAEAPPAGPIEPTQTTGTMPAQPPDATEATPADDTPAEDEAAAAPHDDAPLLSDEALAWEDGPASPPPDRAAPLPIGQRTPAEEPPTTADAEEDEGGTARHPRLRLEEEDRPVPSQDAPTEGEDAPLADPRDEPPSGPVPDEVIRRFEAAIARQQAREARNPRR